MDYELLNSEVEKLRAERLQARRTYVENVTDYPETAAGAKRHIKRIDAHLDIYEKARLYDKNKHMYRALDEVKQLENLSEDEMIDKLADLVTISWSIVSGHHSTSTSLDDITEGDLEC